MIEAVILALLIAIVSFCFAWNPMDAQVILKIPMEFSRLLWNLSIPAKKLNILYKKDSLTR